MDILIPDGWLREHLDTKAKPQQIANLLSLCGPSIEKVDKVSGDYIYHVEVTTNRIDTASVRGLAREANAILPRFGIKAVLKNLSLNKSKSSVPLDIVIKNDSKLCKRILAVKLDNVVIKDSPSWLKKRLEMVGQRSLNSTIDITNYVMWELGHPMHVFDYDKLTHKKIIVRPAHKGEKLISLDDKVHTMLGDEVVFDDGTKTIIDLPGIIGAKNSVVDKDTKSILLWIESVDPVKIRQTSMNHAIRTQAATLNEKSVDPELGLDALMRAVSLYEKVLGAKQASKIVDINSAPYRERKITVPKQFIDKKIGIEINKNDIANYLQALGFTVKWQRDTLIAGIPSFRSSDIQIQEDIVEEIARIYGYHNLPSARMSGPLPQALENSTFEFEKKIKQILKGHAGCEVYTLSLVAKSDIKQKSALKIKNPLGKDTSYMRTSLAPSLINAAKDNSNEKEPYFLFELANIYLPRKNNLPFEILTLAAIFDNYEYRDAKGILESLLEELRVKNNFIPQDSNGYKAGMRLVDKKIDGIFGYLESNYLYFELNLIKLFTNHAVSVSYKAAPTFPAQTEDLTLIFPAKTTVDDVISYIRKTNTNIAKIVLKDIYGDSFTFEIHYQSIQKTLTNNEVKEIRTKLLNTLSKNFGIVQKN